MKFVYLDCEGVPDALHRQVLRTDFSCSHCHVLVLPALVAERFEPRANIATADRGGSGRTVRGSGADVSRRYFLEGLAGARDGVVEDELAVPIERKLRDGRRVPLARVRPARSRRLEPTRPTLSLAASAASTRSLDLDRLSSRTSTRGWRSRDDRS